MSDPIFLVLIQSLKAFVTASKIPGGEVSKSREFVMPLSSKLRSLRYMHDVPILEVPLTTRIGAASVLDMLAGHFC